MIPDDPFWTAAHEVLDLLRRRRDEQALHAAVDGDRELDELALVLKAKRGCRR